MQRRLHTNQSSNLPRCLFSTLRYRPPSVPQHRRPRQVRHSEADQQYVGLGCHYRHCHPTNPAPLPPAAVLYVQPPSESERVSLPDRHETDSDEEEEAIPYTPPRQFNSMLVFALPNLPSLMETLIDQARPVIRPLSSRAAPANGLYYLARFAALCCDPTWVEEVIVTALDKIQDAVRVSEPDLDRRTVVELSSSGQT